jgi:hypothetical protein
MENKPVKKFTKKSFIKILPISSRLQSLQQRYSSHKIQIFPISTLQHFKIFIMSSITTTLVVGATGETGKHVVNQLLQKQPNHRVKVICRSKDKMLSLLQELGTTDTANLTVLEVPSFQEMSQDTLKEQVAGCDAVVSCLGHNLTATAIWGRKDRGLVGQAAERLSDAIQANGSKAKLVFMGSDGVDHPAGTDNKRKLGDRIILNILRTLVPPVRDNEAAAACLYKLGTGKLEWCVVRPTDLENKDTVSEYVLYDKPPGGLFGDGIASRINVAAFMVKLIVDDATWNKYKHQMPVLHNQKTAA